MILTQHPLIQRLYGRQGEDQLIRSQIVDEHDQIVVSEQVATLEWFVWDTTSNTAAPTLVDSGTLDVNGGCWYDTEQFDPPDWPASQRGYNFAYWFPASLFETTEPGDRQFKVEVHGTMEITNRRFTVNVILNMADSLRAPD